MPESVGTGPAVAYLLKGYPRLSELFIASELYRLEQAGFALRLFVIRPPDEDQRHPVVDRIRARPHYLPATTSLSGAPFGRWLAANLPAFAPALRRTARRRPAGLARASGAALAQSLRARRLWWSWPKKVFARDLLLGVALADQVLEAGDVQHLHAHFAHGATTVTWYASVITGVPFSFTGHAKDIYADALNSGGLLRRKLLAARFAVTCTEANRRHLRAIAPRARVHRIYHGLNADFSQLTNGTAPASPAPPAAGELRLLAVGRLVPKKGFDVLVEACRLLRERGVTVSARIVGERGEHAAELQRRIVACGLERQVRLERPMSQRQLYDAYSAADAFCLPCRVTANGDRDGIPNVLVEAMACGLCVVTTRISGIPELIVDGENGLLVAPDDPTALADALGRLHASPALARRLGEQGRATVRERFDGDRLAGELAELFRVVLA